MSSTQGHTNIHTVHTTVDISVLLGEINRIADDSYSKGFECGYDVGVKKGRADERAELLDKVAEKCDALMNYTDDSKTNAYCITPEGYYITREQLLKVIAELKADVRE